MQKVVNISPVLSVTHSTDSLNEKIKTNMYVLSNKNKIERNTASHLHNLFFGKKTFAVLHTIAYENKVVEPDYFSSYE